MRRRLAVPWSVAVAAFTIGFASSVAASDVMCGQVITKNTTLHEDVRPCPGKDDNRNDRIPPYALRVAANNITLDLGGHDVGGLATTGDGVGILLHNVTGVTIKNGEVKDFDAGVAILGGGSNTVTGVNVQRNVGRQDPDSRNLFSECMRRARQVPEDPSFGSIDAASRCTTALRIEIGDFGDGIAIASSSDNVITGNEVSLNGPFDGIGIFGFFPGVPPNRNRIENNDVHDNAVPRIISNNAGLPEVVRFDQGIDVQDEATGTIISNNQSKRNGGVGIFVKGSESTIRGNVADQNTNDAGIILHASVPRSLPGIDDRRIVDNNIAENNQASSNSRYGIRVSSQGNQIVGNTALNNGGESAAANFGFDLRDTSFNSSGNLLDNCGSNVWRNNRYLTADPPCAAG